MAIPVGQTSSGSVAFRRGCTPPAVPDEDRRRAEAMVSVLGALAEPARPVALQLLARHGQLCVCELQEALSLAQPTVSHHLKVLREAGLVEADRRGPWVYYRLHRDGLKRLVAELVDLL